MNNSVREIQLKDKEQWQELYQGYANFYKVLSIVLYLLVEFL